MDFRFSQCILSFHVSLRIKSVLKALKRDFERVVLIAEGEISFFVGGAVLTCSVIMR